MTLKGPGSGPDGSVSSDEDDLGMEGQVLSIWYLFRWVKGEWKRNDQKKKKANSKFVALELVCVTAQWKGEPQNPASLIHAQGICSYKSY